ncbi:ABC transporter ATP-binding protein [Terrihabitans rhizophilus]|uniref:ABC transporter ATP-binding protein n=1 Tax=Terrihabitans rhizophilus TaxID=3092662 RepID=A0ABU4RPP5_9HYPH|nr:ABC transporter ATP-binding protein [Terrihabitans sp. PJ23]MDX6806811.1 ABC transporter ATP-binding protein [Terrihabitans sp. PJ23]
MSATLLETRQITRRFGGLVAVDGVDLDVAEGEVHGLIGPNGAGKTTMLNLLSGHLPSSSGSILFADADVTRHAAEKRAIAGIRRTFQNLKLFKELPALDNVMVGLHASTRSEIFHALLRTPFQRREEREIVERAREALDFVGLGPFADKAAGSLPYGHQRLLEIARAFVARPKLLLLDEPAAGLNGAESKALVDLIRRIRAAGTTTVLVEHHMDVVMPTCDRITVLNYGKLLAKGTPQDIRHNSEVIGAYLGKGSALKRERAAQEGAVHAAP